MKLFDLQGRVALVTGGTQGIGLAIVQALAAHGAAVVVSDRQPQACDQVAAGLRQQGAEAQGLAADLLVEGQAELLAQRAEAWRGRVDVLVSNAGIQGPAGPLAQATDEDWQQVMALNLRAAATLANALIPGMAGRGGGRVVLMSSIAGLRGNGQIGLYGLSKAALAQLARNLAVEWGPQGVCVNAVSPGLVRSPLSARMIDDNAFMARRLKATPLRRVGEPQEIAGVVVMLAAAAGGFITGQNIVVDGGTTVSDGS